MALRQAEEGKLRKLDLEVYHCGAAFRSDGDDGLHLALIVKAMTGSFVTLS
jgi:hypothetical protein